MEYTKEDNPEVVLFLIFHTALDEIAIFCYHIYDGIATKSKRRYLCYRLNVTTTRAHTRKF